jgi:ribosomal protein L37AE/L43A
VKPHLRRCLECRGKLVPNDGTKVGVWYCPHCDYCYTDEQIRQAVVNQPGAKVIQIGDRRR